MQQFLDQMLADIFDRGQSLSSGDIISELVQEATEIHQVWSSSHGWAPPDDIFSFVQAAVAITEPWYTKQQAMVQDAGRSTTKPWWKFW